MMEATPEKSENDSKPEVSTVEKTKSKDEPAKAEVVESSVVESQPETAKATDLEKNTATPVVAEVVSEKKDVIDLGQDLSLNKQDLEKMAKMKDSYPAAMLIAAIVVLVAGSYECAEFPVNGCYTSDQRFAVAMGVILTIVSGCYIFALYKEILKSGNYELVVAGVLAVCWLAVVGVTTFSDGPFAVSQLNGLIGAWVGLLASLGNLVKSAHLMNKFKRDLQKYGLPLVLLIASSALVVLTSILHDDGNSDCCGTSQVIGIIWGVFSIILCVILIAVEKLKRTLSIVLTVGWSLVGLLLTFDIFDTFANGYVACWAAIITSFLTLKQTQKKSSE